MALHPHLLFQVVLFELLSTSKILSRHQNQQIDVLIVLKVSRSQIWVKMAFIKTQVSIQRCQSLLPTQVKAALSSNHLQQHSHSIQRWSVLIPITTF